MVITEFFQSVVESDSFEGRAVIFTNIMVCGQSQDTAYRISKTLGAYNLIIVSGAFSPKIYASFVFFSLSFFGFIKFYPHTISFL